MSASNNASQEAYRILNGGDSFFDRKAAQYFLDFVKNTNRNDPIAYDFCVGCESILSDKISGFPSGIKKKPKKGDAKVAYAKKDTPQRNAVSQKDWKLLETHFQAEVDEPENGDEPPAFYSNLLKISEYLGFSEADKNALEFLSVLSANYELEQVLTSAVRNYTAVGSLIAHIHGDTQAYKKYTSAVRPTGKFFQYGIINKISYSAFPQIDGHLAEKIQSPELTKEEVIEAILGTPTDTDLDIDDFAYMGPDLDFVADLISNAVKTKAKGVNVLIYGPAGGGKTELSKTLARHLGLSLYAVGEEDKITGPKKVGGVVDDDGDLIGDYPISESETTDRSRLADMLRAQSLLSDSDGAAVLFDEIEDLLIKGTDTEKSSDTESKILINRLLENNAVPTIWCGNDPQKFHEAVRDRFIFSIYVDSPPMGVRYKIWARQLAIQGLELPEEDVKELAREYDASPRKITKAIQAAKISGNGIDAIRTTLPASSKITTGSRDAVKDPNAVNKYYNPTFSNVTVVGREEPDEALADLIKRGRDRTPFSLMAQGVEGSGLRSLTSRLSEYMLMNPAVFSMASLSQPTQFSTPAGNIAAAFEAASDTRRLLIVNDIEHLADNPTSPSSWSADGLPSVFVHYAQRHALPFVVTSTKDNFEFPQSFTSVFSDFVKTDYMTTEQKRAAFETIYGQEAPAALDGLEKVVIADLINVRYFLNRVDATRLYPEHVVDMIQEQVDIRGNSQGSIGFTSGSNAAGKPYTLQLAHSNDDNTSVAKASSGSMPIANTLR